MGAAGAAEQGLGGGVLEPAEAVRPRPSGVHHHRCAHLSLPHELVLDHGAPHLASAPLEADDPGVGGDVGAVQHCRAGGGHHQAGVVALRVVVAGAPHESPLAEHRFLRQKGALAEDAVSAHIPERSQQVVEQHAGRQLPERYPVARVDRKHEGQLAHQVGSDGQQGSAFPRGFVH